MGLSGGMSMPEIRGMVAALRFWISDCGFWIDVGGARGPSLQNRKSKIQNDYPCFCLCLVLVQITRTTPLRRTILQFSQIRRTLARTFIALPQNTLVKGE